MQATEFNQPAEVRREFTGRQLRSSWNKGKADPQGDPTSSSCPTHPAWQQPWGLLSRRCPLEISATQVLPPSAHYPSSPHSRLVSPAPTRCARRWWCSDDQDGLIVYLFKTISSSLHIYLFIEQTFMKHLLCARCCRWNRNPQNSLHLRETQNLAKEVEIVLLELRGVRGCYQPIGIELSPQE